MQICSKHVKMAEKTLENRFFLKKHLIFTKNVVSLPKFFRKRL
jgi:hypothetical protein